MMSFTGDEPDWIQEWRQQLANEMNAGKTPIEVYVDESNEQEVNVYRRRFHDQTLILKQVWMIHLDKQDARLRFDIDCQYQEDNQQIQHETLTYYLTKSTLISHFNSTPESKRDSNDELMVHDRIRHIPIEEYGLFIEEYRSDASDIVCGFHSHVTLVQPSPHTSSRCLRFHTLNPQHLETSCVNICGCCLLKYCIDTGQTLYTLSTMASAPVQTTTKPKTKRKRNRLNSKTDKAPPPVDLLALACKRHQSSSSSLSSSLSSS